MSPGASPVERTFTILDDGQPMSVAARLEGGRVRVEAGDVQAALGWSLGPQGLCRDEACILVPPGCPDDLARALATILSDPELRRAQGAIARRRIHLHHGVRAWSHQVLALYEEMRGAQRSAEDQQCA